MHLKGQKKLKSGQKLLTTSLVLPFYAHTTRTAKDGLGPVLLEAEDEHNKPVAWPLMEAYVSGQQLEAFRPKLKKCAWD